MFTGLTDSEAKALVDTAKAIGADPQHLWELINFESSHDPQKANPASSAKGLVQFMNATAVALGFKSSQDLVTRYPSYEAQMRGPVKDYFLKLAPVTYPYSSRQLLFMKVFYPVAMRLPIDTNFVDLVGKHPPKVKGVRQTPEQAKADFKKANPGIVTIADYLNKAVRNALAKATKGTLAYKAVNLKDKALSVITPKRDKDAPPSTGSGGGGINSAIILFAGIVLLTLYKRKIFS